MGFTPFLLHMPPTDVGSLRMQEALLSAHAAVGRLSLSSGGAERSTKPGSVRGDDDLGEPAVKDIVKHVPDGGTCLTCPRRDDQEDPVAKVVGKLNEHGSVVLMAWSYPPRNGKTAGDCCHYRMRVYLKEGKTMDMKIGDWKSWIAEKGLAGSGEHQAKVIV